MRWDWIVIHRKGVGTRRGWVQDRETGRGALFVLIFRMLINFVQGFYLGLNFLCLSLWTLAFASLRIQWHGTLWKTILSTRTLSIHLEFIISYLGGCSDIGHADNKTKTKSKAQMEV